MNTKTRLLIATLAASVALSFSASAGTITVTNTNDSGPGSLRAAAQAQTTEQGKMLVQPLAVQNQPNTAALLLPSIQKVREAAARFTPPEFCYVGKMKVACTITDAPSKDPTGTRP